MTKVILRHVHKESPIFKTSIAGIATVTNNIRCMKTQRHVHIYTLKYVQTPNTQQAHTLNCLCL